jgi:hypothetical protein
VKEVMEKIMDGKIVELLNEMLVSRIEQKIAEKLSRHYDLLDFSECMQDALRADRGVLIEEEQLSELRSGTLHSYISKAQSHLQKQKFGYGTLRSQVRKRTNRVQGIKRANDRINRDPQDRKPYEEGIGSAVGNIAKNVAADTIAHGLGVNGSTVHDFLHHLTKKSPASPKPATQKPSKPQHAPQATQKPAKPQQTPPAATTHSSTTWQPVEIHHVFNGTPSDHEHSLNQAITHHNIGTWAKSKGDHSKAKIHFRARDKHFRNYVTNAPRENLKKLNQGKVKSIFK